ncbi:protein mcbE [Salmonella enterica subsp. enterica]|nr:protein mcbE [Salmonella enterica subsp. enterica]EBR2769032.1 protein mcbE [Salmonella enterica]EBT4151339.1 protein mcbE [Salmonella enterica subsp. enterica]EED9464909.1 protein mcbE [Salmonella enterica subsp. enterica serovar Abaetetuba]
MATIKMTIIFLMEQIRTPFSLLWTVMSPTVLFFFLHFNEMEIHYGDTPWLSKQISWFVGYISFSVVLFNYCLYLTGRRESGFIATFVHNLEGRLLFIRSQLIASLIMSIFYVCFFILVVLLGFQAKPDSQIVIIILKSIEINAFLMVSLTFIASFRVTFQTASTIYSVLITICMVSGIVSLKYNEGIIYWINQVNPIAIYSTILQPDQELSLITIFFYSTMFIVSLISAITFKTEPVWSSQ